jgi:hypothetical protein
VRALSIEAPERGLLFFLPPLDRPQVEPERGPARFAHPPLRHPAGHAASHGQVCEGAPPPSRSPVDVAGSTSDRPGGVHSATSAINGEIRSCAARRQCRARRPSSCPGAVEGRTRAAQAHREKSLLRDRPGGVHSATSAINGEVHSCAARRQCRARRPSSCPGAATGEPEPRRRDAKSLRAVTKRRRFAARERSRCADLAPREDPSAEARR